MPAEHRMGAPSPAEQHPKPESGVRRRDIIEEIDDADVLSSVGDENVADKTAASGVLPAAKEAPREAGEGAMQARMRKVFEDAKQTGREAKEKNAKEQEFFNMLVAEKGVDGAAQDMLASDDLRKISVFNERYGNQVDAATSESLKAHFMEEFYKKNPQLRPKQ